MSTDSDDTTADRSTEVELDAEAAERLERYAEKAGVDVETFLNDLAMALPRYDFPGDKFPLTDHEWAMDRLRVEASDNKRTDFFDHGFEVYKHYDEARPTAMDGDSA